MPLTNPHTRTQTSPTAGMTLEQRILHVGGRNNAAGYVEFGSTQAVKALVQQVLRDLPAQADGATAAGYESAIGHLCALLEECTPMLREMRQLVDDLHKHWSPGGAPERGEFPLLDRVDDWLTARQPETPAPEPPHQKIRTDVLTDAQITAGAAVTTIDGKPVGRNIAIEVFHAMCKAGQEGGAT